MEILAAICLVTLGLVVGLTGYKLFRVVMPIAGLVVGATIGFTGFQAIFGTGVTSTTLALLVAVILALVLAVLSYAFFDLAVVILMGVALSSLFTLVGLAFGLSSTGFALGLLSLSGFIIGLILASSSVFLAENLVSLVTAYVGAGLVLAGVFIMTSGSTLQAMYENGILNTVSEHAGGSLWWVLVWIAGVVIMRQVQLRSLWAEIFPKDLGYTVKKK
ncbi:MAG: hypothetical protein WAS27_01630 [Candidatus Saccharimonadales bacterium]